MDPRTLMSPLPLGVAPAAGSGAAPMGLDGPAGEDEQDAAARIQAIQRGKLARRELAERAKHIKEKRAEEERLEKEAAARKRQKKMSKRKGGSTPKPRPTPMEEGDPVASLGLQGSAEESAAATKMQAMQRGKATRRHILEEKEQEHAATVIQARHRGRMSRRSSPRPRPEPEPEPEEESDGTQPRSQILIDPRPTPLDPRPHTTSACSFQRGSEAAPCVT